MRQPNEAVRALAVAYCQAQGMPAPVVGHWAPVDEIESRQVAAVYNSLPEQQHGARPFYGKLSNEIAAQYQAARAAGYTFERWDAPVQPYANSAEMCADVREHRHMWVFAGGEPHPYLTGAENYAFRAVHDLFGHAAEGYQFGPRGEHNAWLHHSMMFSPDAQRALTTETRGQNCWVNFGPFSHLPVCDRPFAAQKCAILPAWVCDWRRCLAQGGE